MSHSVRKVSKVGVFKSLYCHNTGKHRPEKLSFWSHFTQSHFSAGNQTFSKIFSKNQECFEEKFSAKKNKCLILKYYNYQNTFTQEKSPLVFLWIGSWTKYKIGEEATPTKTGFSNVTVWHEILLQKNQQEKKQIRY